MLIQLLRETCQNSGLIQYLSTLPNKKIQAVIPKRRNAIDKSNSSFDKYLYKIKHLIENLFVRLKQFRSIATRYDKSKNN